MIDVLKEEKKNNNIVTVGFLTKSKIYDLREKNINYRNSLHRISFAVLYNVTRISSFNVKVSA